MKTLLINPPREVPQPADLPPLGLAYLAGAIHAAGHEVGILEASSYSWAKLANQLKALNPQVVGVTCWSIERAQAFKTVAITREVLPNSLILLGGPHPSTYPLTELLFERCHVDIVAKFEGEETVPEILDAVRCGASFEGVSGIWYKHHGDIRRTAPRGVTKDLNALPMPRYDGIRLDNYNGLPEIRHLTTASMVTSRGCPYACNFCSAPVMGQGKVRFRSADNILEEIQTLTEKYGVGAIYFADDLYTTKKKLVLDICAKMIESRIVLPWVAVTSASYVDEELVIAMKEAGCYRLDFGIESGSPKILKNIADGKVQKHTIDEARQAFALCHKHGIRPRSYLMVGNPGEDESTIDETIALMKEIRPYDTWGATITMIEPGTRLYNLAIQKGVITDRFFHESDATPYYTGEKTLEELQKLRLRLVRGLVWNNLSPRTLVIYLVRNLFYSRLLGGQHWLRFPRLKKLYYYLFVTKAAKGIEERTY
ncbi:B12-binding domain-containing radical SAM protein [Candidatus Bathyarchaeota archaeon]|nr:MAG: B12-binding domain-containing radical SAM protein [Candidatus Bathyarchaeota archaeon]